MNIQSRSVPLDVLSVEYPGRYSIHIVAQDNNHNLAGLFHVRVNNESAYFTGTEFHAILQKAVNEKQNKES